MFEIKITKVFEDIEKKKNIQELVSSFPRKNRISNKDMWVLKFEKNEEYLGGIIQISSRLCEFKLSDIMFDFCIAQNMSPDGCKRFIDAFFLYCGDFLEYSINITTIALRLFLENNEVLNIESFLFFNMRALGKEMTDRLSNPETLDALSGIMDSNLLDSIALVQTIAEADAMLTESGIQKERIKDFKIYFDNGIKCISDKKIIIDKKYFEDKYGIAIDDYSDLEVIIIIAALVYPDRIILFNSLSENDKLKITELIHIITPICGDIKIFSADEKFPR